MAGGSRASQSVLIRVYGGAAAKDLLKASLRVFERLRSCPVVPGPERLRTVTAIFDPIIGLVHDHGFGADILAASICERDPHVAFLNHEHSRPRRTESADRGHDAVWVRKHRGLSVCLDVE